VIVAYETQNISCFISLFFYSVFCFICRKIKPKEILRFLLAEDFWVRKTLDSMTLDEKIAQLMMITVYPRQSDTDKAKINKILIKTQTRWNSCHAGQSGKTAQWINEFQENSDCSACWWPLMVNGGFPCASTAPCATPMHNHWGSSRFHLPLPDGA
jgi:hypothetical protein